MEVCNQRCELRKRRMENKRMLRIVVREKVKRTYKNGFNLDEIIYFCDLLDIPLERFVFGVLQTSTIDYEKFVKGIKVYIFSEKFIDEKIKYLKSVQNQFNKKINWNIRNYYNKNQIFDISSKWYVNPRDFSNKVLDKSIICVRRVLNDEKSKKRLFIGNYVNVQLPDGYVSKNVKTINSLIKLVIYKITSRFGRRLSKTDLEDEYQDSLIYVNFKGNGLKRDNKKVIVSDSYDESHRKMLYNKLYYHKLNKIFKDYPRNDYEYNDKLKNEVSIENYEDTINTIYSLTNDKKEVEILKMLSVGYTKEDIISKEKITLEEYDFMMDKFRKSFRENYKI